MKNIARERERVARLRERDKWETYLLNSFGSHTALLNSQMRSNKTKANQDKKNNIKLRWSSLCAGPRKGQFPAGGRQSPTDRLPCDL